MAIVPAHLGIKISIVCNGAALQEYDDDDQEPHDTMVSKYIEATSGAEFGILCELFPPWPPYTVLLDYFLDHKWVWGTFLEPVNYKRDFSHLEEGPETISNGQAFRHQFAFAALTVGMLYTCLGVFNLLRNTSRRLCCCARSSATNARHQEHGRNHCHGILCQEP